ncbi:MAG: cation:proton antiporter, partial [Phycisphaerales bacterium]|nr:cation:proton antiporter [Phycisphaerales bacterium]
MVNELFFEVAAVILIAGLLSLVAQRLRQPLIIAYILTGAVVGPGVLALADSTDAFAAMAQIGIAFLLFIVGLHLNWRNIKDVGRVALLAGIAQVVCTSLAGFVIGRAVGFPLMTSVFVAVAFSFSSTIVIVKLLSDKEDLDR